MNEVVNLKKISKKAIYSYHKDGIIDIALGFYLFMIAVMFEFAETPGLARVIPVLFIPVWLQAKEKITGPRIGHVKMGSNTQMKFLRLGLILFIAMGAGVLALVVTDVFPTSLIEFFELYFNSVIGILGAVMFVIFGFAWALNRFYLYGALFLAAFFTAQYLLIWPLYPLMFFGAVLMGTGCVVFMDFLRKNPVVINELEE